MFFCSYLALVLVGITWTTTDGALKFTQEPGAQIYSQEGSDAVLTWDYKVDNRAAELKAIFWTVYNKTKTSYVTLIAESKIGVIQYSRIALSAYGTERLKKEGRGTLVLKDITFEDSTNYRCILKGEAGIVDVESVIVELIVTGRASVTPAVIPVKEGGSATFTCNATNVPSQNFTWMRGGQNMPRIVTNSKYEINSVAGSSQLTIKNISKSDHGYYVCDATVNVDQPSSARGFLGLVSLKEDTDLCRKGDQYATINKTTTICCPVRGFPPPEVTWKLPSRTVKTENTMLRITPEKDDDFGNYTCSAVNVGTVKGPFVISLKQEVLPGIDVKRVTELKPGDNFSWSPVDGALEYIVSIHDNGKYMSKTLMLLGGNQLTSLPIPYNTLPFRSSDKKPDPVDVFIEVLAIDENKDIVKGKGGGFQIKIFNAAAALEVSIISVIMLFIMVIILH